MTLREPKPPTLLGPKSITRIPEGKRQQGRPRTTWRRSTKKEFKAMHLTWREIWKVAQDWLRWREVVKALNASDGAMRTDDDDGSKSMML